VVHRINEYLKSGNGGKYAVTYNHINLLIKSSYKMVEITGANQNSYQVEEDKVLFLASKS